MTTKDGSCPCKSGRDYIGCCGGYISGKNFPDTAEQLMRSRYSAYVKEEIKYLKVTLWPRYQKDFNELASLMRARDSRWIGLEILETGKGEKSDKEGYVLFIARSVVDGILNEQREKSLFRKKGVHWYYVKAVSE